ncbi:MAG: hypothetical protein ACXWL2_03605 [Candidatus Chromulinivorax sp.]
MMKNMFKFLFVFLYAAGLQAVVSQGDTVDGTTTFQFSIGPAIYDSGNQILWTLSGQDLSSFSSDIQEYGISYTRFISPDSPTNVNTGVVLTSFPYITSQAGITFFNEQGQLIVPTDSVVNPLLGQRFITVSMLGANFIVTVAAATEQNPLQDQFVYLIQSSTFYDNAFGKNSPDGFSIINQLNLGAGNQVKKIAGLGSAILFTAYAQGVFGTDNSYISFASLASAQGVINEQLLTCSGLIAQASEQVTTSTAVLTANTYDLQSIGSSIAFYPSGIRPFQMYVGLDVTAFLDPGSAAVGLFAANATIGADSNPSTITFSPVLPDLIATAGLQTPVSTTQNRRVAVNDITVTTTSTGLSYLITSRYNGSENQFVYAMPMVTMSTDQAFNGMIANFDSIAQNFQIVGVVYRSQGFNLPIGVDANGNPDQSQAAQIDINSSNPAVISRLLVGGGSVPLNPGQFVQEVISLGDAVYITSHTPFAPGSAPGMFKSQALFDEQGRIMAWTPWQRVAGTDDQMSFAIKNRIADSTMYVAGPLLKNVVQTTWNNTTILTSLIAAVSGPLQKNNGGIQAVSTVSNATAGLSNFNFVIASGNNTVAIAQSGSLVDGNIVIDSPQDIALIDDALNLNIGSVVTTIFAHNSVSDNNWLFMGGSNGLAVLSNDTTGIGFHGQLGSLAQLTAAATCKTLGNFSFVKKIASDNNFLYVLTPTAVYRIALQANKFTLSDPAALNAEIVVSASSIGQYSFLTDMIVDNNLMILGTTAGMYSLDLTLSLPVTPIAIQIPGGLSTVSRLWTISSANNFYEKFYNQSNLYVLSIDFTTEQARLNRFTISRGVIQPIEDQLFEGENGPLLNFNTMNNDIFIDGSLGFATCYRIGLSPVKISYLQYTLQAGRSSSQILLQASTSNVSLDFILDAFGLVGVRQDYASGCLLLAGSFGLFTDS